jgi:putative transposase
VKKRFTEEQIVRILQEAEAGVSARDVCRKHNVSEQSVYRWKVKYGGMGVRAVKRLRELEREHAELKKIIAEQALDIRMRKDVNAKKFCAFLNDDARRCT